MARNPGDNFVTDLGIDASPRELESIGVFGAKQQYAIQFSEEAAVHSDIRLGRMLENVFTIPGPCRISGACVVTRVR